MGCLDAVVTTNVLGVDKNIGDSPLASHFAQCLLESLAFLHVIEFVDLNVARGIMGAKKSLGAGTVSAHALAKDDNGVKGYLLLDKGLVIHLLIVRTYDCRSNGIAGCGVGRDHHVQFIGMMYCSRIMVRWSM